MLSNGLRGKAAFPGRSQPVARSHLSPRRGCLSLTQRRKDRWRDEGLSPRFFQAWADQNSQAIGQECEIPKAAM